MKESLREEGRMQAASRQPVKFRRLLQQKELSRFDS